MLILKGCRKCGGDLFSEQIHLRPSQEDDLVCAQCGWRDSIVTVDRNTRKHGGGHKKVKVR